MRATTPGAATIVVATAVAVLMFDGTDGLPFRDRVLYALALLIALGFALLPALCGPKLAMGIWLFIGVYPLWFFFALWPLAATLPAGLVTAAVLIVGRIRTRCAR